VKTILHVGKFYPPVPGGMEQVVASLCRVTSDGFANRALVFNSEMRTVDEVVDGIQVTRVGTIATAGSVPIAPAFAAALRRIHADAIVLHEPNPWALLSFTVAPPAAPLAIWFHSEVVRPRLQYALFYDPVARAAYQRAARIIVSSPALAAHADVLRPHADRVRVIPFGIEPARWRPTAAVLERARALRAEHGAAPLVLFVGRMVRYKGVDVLLRALAQTNARAVLVGCGPMFDEWSRLARSLGLRDRVIFIGEVAHDELAASYHACDMFVLPSVSRAEAFGFVQLEAMACGKPVISTRVPSGVPWVNRDGETGFTVPPDDVGALRDAILKLASDSALRARMGAAGRARVDAEFTAARMRGAVEAFYRELLGDAGRG
jgi:glycosyltransferase involved in cell wall biosynthesis